MKSTTLLPFMSVAIWCTHVTLLFWVAVSNASATDWKTAAPGQPITDGKIEIGQFTIRLPAGEWFVIAKGQDRSTGAWTGAAPTFLSIAFAQLENGKLLGAFSITTPASSISANWSDSLCNVPAPLLVDTAGSNFRHPECLTFTKIDPQIWQGDANSYYGRAAGVLRTLNVQPPDQAFHIMYLKGYRQDNIRLHALIPGDPAAGIPSAVEAWGRDMRIALRASITGDTKEAVLPPLPQ